MNKIKSKISARNSHSVFAVGSLIFLTIISIVWGVTYASDAPADPTNLQQIDNPAVSGLSTNAIYLSWTNNAESNLTQFILERKLNNESTYEPLPNQFIGPTVHNYTDQYNITAGASYDYQIKACLISKTDALSNSITPTTVGIETICSGYSEYKGAMVRTLNVIKTEVSAPTNFRFNPNKLAAATPVVELGWTDNSNNETIFNIKRISTATLNTSTLTFSKESVTTESTGSVILISDPNDVTREVSYYYQVQACAPPVAGDTTPVCSASVSISVRIPPATPIPTTTAIPPPTDLKLYTIPMSVSSEIQIIWKDNSGGKTLFSIERKLSNETQYAVLPHYINPGVTYYTDGGDNVKPGISYDYRVNSCVPASPVGVTPYKCSESPVELFNAIIPISGVNDMVVNAPSGLILSNKPTTTVNGIVQISWTDNSKNESKFIIERRSSPNIAVGPLSSINVGSSSNIAVSNYETGIPRGIDFYYLVKACALPSSSVILAGGSKEICSKPTEFKRIMVPLLTPNLEQNNITSENVVTTSIERISETAPITNPPKSLENTTTTNTAVETKNQQDIVTYSINETSVNIQDISVIVDELKVSVNYTKDNLINLINESILNIININASKGEQIDTLRIYQLRDELVKKVELKFLNLTIITSADINSLKNEIDKDIENIRILAGESIKDSQLSTINSENIVKELNSLSVVLEQNSQILKDRGGDLLYKDTNKDGISDYDSTFVYNIDPIKPSPVSVYEGKEINAAGRILLGFDPSSSNLVKVNIQQPSESVVSVVPSYKVKEIKLTEKKEVLIGGQALPNSFITLYIYSTPIIVTIKTDSNGEWEYLLDKELEDGNHTIYTATVNNTGNIVAKSSGYLFTKTAEAISFQDLPIAEASVNVEKPGLLDGVSLYLAIASLVLIIVSVIVLIGVISKKNSQNQNPV